MSSPYPTWQTDLSHEKKPQIEVIGEDIVVDNNHENVDLLAVENQLTKARTLLILDKPFLGNLVLKLPLKPAQSWCKTTATDAKNFYYSPSFIAQLSKEQTKFVLIHEALHCALTHFVRRGHRSKHRWDLACDFAINPLLIKEGFHPPLDVPIFRQYEGMLAEDIYPMIEDKLNNEPMDQHLYDDNPDEGSQNSDGGMKENSLTGKTDNQGSQGGQSDNKVQANTTENSGENSGKKPVDNNNELAKQPAPLTPDEAQSLASQWQKHLASSAQLAKQSGKLSVEWLKLVDFFLQPQLSWRALLAQYITASARDDFSYHRTSRRSSQSGAIFPSLRSEHINIAIAIDTSGSIEQTEIDEFVSEISNIKSTLSANIALYACDDKLAKGCPWQYQPWQEMNFPKSLGGGKGTNFSPVFKHLENQDVATDLLVYFTDAKGKFPEVKPNHHTIWLVKGKTPVPWGQRVQLND